MARAIPTSVAPVVERLELDGDVVVSVDRLAEVLRDVGDSRDARVLAYELQRAGWLGSVRARGVWEFLPAARGGPYGSGDRYIELRALRAAHGTWPGVLAMESAASALGLAQRAPERGVVALPPGVQMPKALAGHWRAVTLALPHAGVTDVAGLPSWNLEGLLAGIAHRPSSYLDMPGLGQWLPDAIGRLDLAVLLRVLEPAASAVVQRAAYLVGVAGDSDARDAILGAARPRGVTWFGSRRRGGVFDAATQVNDTALAPYLTVGTGS